MADSKFILDDSLISWIKGDDRWNLMPKTRDKQNFEYEWSIKYHCSTTRSQWTNQFGEKLVKFLLERKQNYCKRPRPVDGMRPDLECSHCVVEVKTRNWTTSGTAGDKIYRTPIKYWDIPRIYNKPLLIVLVGYQEYEARHKMKLWNKAHEGNRKFLEMCAERDIFFIGASELLN